MCTPPTHTAASCGGVLIPAALCLSLVIPPSTDYARGLLAGLFQTHIPIAGQEAVPVLQGLIYLMIALIPIPSPSRSPTGCMPHLLWAVCLTLLLYREAISPTEVILS